MIVQTTKSHLLAKGSAEQQSGAFGEGAEREQNRSENGICKANLRRVSKRKQPNRGNRKKGEQNGTQLLRGQNGGARHIGTYHSADAKFL